MIIANSPKISSTKIKVMVTMTLILIASIWFALHSHPVQPVTHYAPGQPGYKVVMKRESLDLDQALDLSLAMGDGRQVDWEEVS